MKQGIKILITAFATGIIFLSCGRTDKPALVMIGTTDIHGTFFNYDFINNEEAPYSLASVSEYVKSVRETGARTVLPDNGDIFQGQPEVYYHNFVDTVSPHLCAEILNYMQYDAATVGNHDNKASEVSADPDYVKRFSEQFEQVRAFVTRPIGHAPEKISSRDALFGPSAFTGMIHTVQLYLTGADISFAAPLSFDVSIGPGEVTVADMFKLYRYENMLYKMTMTGSEIDGFLEHSVGDWFNTVTPANDFILNYRVDDAGKPVI